MCVVTTFLSISNNISSSPVDLDGLPNHIKYCVSVLGFQWTTIRTSPVEIPSKFFNNVRERPLTNLGNKRMAC
jgi:hypothetical protein